jgi:hypothetical protein
MGHSLGGGGVLTKLSVSKVVAPDLLANRAKATCRCGFMAVRNTVN